MVTVGHDEVCTRSGMMTKRHNELISAVRQMLEEAGVSYDMADLRDHVGVKAELVRAKAVDSKGNRIVANAATIEGADILVRGLMSANSRAAVDGTVISEQGTRRTYEAPMLGLKQAELDKVGRYKQMYDTINVDVIGAAMNVGGAIGPGLRRIIARCAEVAGEGLPAWANWTGGNSFASAWTQRLICVVQKANAEGVVQARRGRARAAGVRRV